MSDLSEKLYPMFSVEELYNFKADLEDNPKEVLEAYGVKKPEELYMTDEDGQVILGVLERWFAALRLEGEFYGDRGEFENRKETYQVYKKTEGEEFEFVGYMVTTSGTFAPSSTMYFPMTQAQEDWLLEAKTRPEHDILYAQPRNVGLICKFTGLEALEEEAQ